MFELELDSNLNFTNIGSNTLFFIGSSTYRITLAGWDPADLMIGSAQGLNDFKFSIKNSQIQINLDANSPKVLFLEKISDSQSTFVEVSDDLNFLKSFENSYLEEIAEPALDPDGYTKYSIVLRKGGDKAPWKNQTHSIVYFSHLPVADRLPISMRDKYWIAIPGDVDSFAEGEQIDLRFPGNIETLENQIFTTRMNGSDDVPSGVSHIPSKNNTISFEIDLKDLKSVDLTSVEDSSVLTYVAQDAKWKAVVPQPTIRAVGAEIDSMTGTLSIISSSSEDVIPSFTYDNMKFEAQPEKYLVDAYLSGFYILEFGSGPASISGETNYKVWKNVSSNTIDSNGKDVKTIVFMDLNVGVGWVGFTLSHEEILEYIDIGKGVPITQSVSLEIYGYDAGSMFPPSNLPNYQALNNAPAIFTDLDDKGWANQTRANVEIALDSLKDVRIRNLEDKHILSFEDGVLVNAKPEYSTNLTIHEGLMTISRNSSFKPMMFKTLLTQEPRYFRKSSVPIYARSYGEGEETKIGNRSYIYFGKTSSGKERYLWIECESDGTHKMANHEIRTIAIIYEETSGTWCPVGEKGHVYREGIHTIEDFSLSLLDDAKYYKGIETFAFIVHSWVEMNAATSSWDNGFSSNWFVDGVYKNFGLLEEIGLYWEDDGSGFPGMARGADGIQYERESVMEILDEVYDNTYGALDTVSSTNPVSVKLSISDMFDVNMRVYRIKGVNYIREKGFNWVGVSFKLGDRTNENYRSYFMDPLHNPLYDPKTNTTWIVKDSLSTPSWILVPGRFLEWFEYKNFSTEIIDEIPMNSEAEWQSATPPGTTVAMEEGDVLIWDQAQEKFVPGTFDLSVSAISDFQVRDPVAGESLVFDGNAWKNVQLDLKSLPDVDATAAVQNSVLIYDPATDSFKTSPGTLPYFDMSEAPVADQILVYNADSEKWIPANQIDKSLQSLSLGTDGTLTATVADPNSANSDIHSVTLELAKLADVNFPEADLVDGQFLRYNRLIGQWEPYQLVATEAITAVDLKLDSVSLADDGLLSFSVESQEIIKFKI